MTMGIRKNNIELGCDILAMHVKPKAQATLTAPTFSASTECCYEQLYQEKPAELRAMTERAISAIRQMWEVLYALDEESKAVFRNSKYYPRFRPPLLSPYQFPNDGSEKVSISFHRTPATKALEHAQAVTAKNKQQQTKKQNKLELALYELKSQIS